MVNRNTYAREYNAVATRQEQIMFSQVRRALNSFVRKYAKVYQVSAVNINESLILAEHQDRIQVILERRYKFIIPFFSKFALDGFRDDITKQEEEILINQQDRLVENFILANAVKKAATIAKTSITKVRSRIDAGIKAGDSISEIAASIRGVQLLNTARAETIARTEVHGAANYGAIETARNAESELNIKMVKEWVAVADSRTRDTHAAMDGQTVDVDSSFNVMGFAADRPLDPRLPAEEAINCRCTMMFRRKTYN